MPLKLTNHEVNGSNSITISNYFTWKSTKSLQNAANGIEYRFLPEKFPECKKCDPINGFMHGYPRGRSLKAETKFDKGAGTQEVTVQCASGANFMPINRPSIKFQGGVEPFLKLKNCLAGTVR